jgi:general secretion pathway protein G
MLGEQAARRMRSASAIGSRRMRAFTLLEILIVLAILGVVSAIAYPKYQDYRERVRVNQAITDIRAIDTMLRVYMTDYLVPPDSLAAVGQEGKLDPWGRPYEYLRLQGVKGVAGKARKNKNLVPLNSDFDLYSVGKDGESSGPLTAKASRDDVILANDGRFVGLASDYE